MISTTRKRATKWRACQVAARHSAQPPAPGVEDSHVLDLLREMLAAPNPPVALFTAVLAARRNLAELGRHAEGLARIGNVGVGLIEATHVMAEVTPGHDLYDTDGMLRHDSDGCDRAAALGVLLRVKRPAGIAIDSAATAYLIDDDDCYRGMHHQHGVTYATDLLLAARRRYAHALQ